MQTASASPLVCSGAILSAISGDGRAPDWITIFPTLGPFSCRDGREYVADAEALLAAFASDAIDVPLDISHSTDIKAPLGERADAVGWLKEMKVEGGALKGRVEWTGEGAQLIVDKKYRYTSPSFWHDSAGRTERLRAISLVNSPALANQPALAAAQADTKETSMKTIATALGLSADANEAACLAAVTDMSGKLKDVVPKNVHETAVANLAAVSAELSALKKAGRDEKIAALIESALKGKKILPAEKDHYVALCSTDEGLSLVEKLIAARSAVLAGSGLDDRKPPEGSGQTAAQLAAKAGKIVSDGRARGVEISIADAMTQVTRADAA